MMTFFSDSIENHGGHEAMTTLLPTDAVLFTLDQAWKRAKKPRRRKGAKPTPEPLMLSRSQCAALVGVSTGTWDKMLANGTMPKPVPSGGIRRNLWNKAAVEKAIRVLGGETDHELGDNGPNDWDEKLK
jgi:predicted DNA-binding transcriptional regulator AlpA